NRWVDALWSRPRAWARTQRAARPAGRQVACSAIEPSSAPARPFLPMPVAERPAVVTYRHADWARLRVRGLLHNPALGEVLSARLGPPVDVRVATGSVRVPLAPGHGEGFWIDRIARAVDGRSEGA